MKTLEQRAAWLVFSLSVLMVYGLLSLFLIAPTHARDIPEPGEFAWIDSIFAWPEPTFAQMEWPDDASIADGANDVAEQAKWLERSGWAQYSKRTGERTSPLHPTLEECANEEQPKVMLPYAYECRRETDPPTPIVEPE